MRTATAVIAALFALSVVAAGAGELTPPPVWQGKTLLGPARGAAGLVKAGFTYKAAAKQLVFRLGDRSVEMTLGSKSAKANGAAVTLPQAPRTVKGATYVPLAALYKGLGFDVHPDPKDKTAWIVCTSKVCRRLKVPPQP